MEYNVLYLVKALLKKWYVILLVMAVAAVAAVGLSKISYKKAVADYQKNLAIMQSENKKVTLKTEYSYQLDDATLALLSDYVEQTGGNHIEKAKLISVAKTTFNERMLSLLEDKTVLAEVAEKYEISEEELAEYLEILPVGKDGFLVSVFQLSEAQATEMRDAYLAALKEKVQNSFISFDFEQKTPEITVTDEAAAFIDAVMEEPTPPSLTRTVITGALYAFAFACIGVLVYIFVKEGKMTKTDSRKDDKEETDCAAQ